MTEAWDRGEKLSVTNLTRLRCTSTSRLNSISNLTGCEASSSVDVRLDAGLYATRHSPLPLHLPSTSTATSSPTPATPSSTQSLLSPSSPFSAGLVTSTPLSDSYAAAAATPPTSTSYSVPIFTPPPLSPGPTPPPAAVPLVGQQALIRSHSSSSSILLGETPHSRGLARSHHSVSCLNNGGRAGGSHTPVGVPAISSPVQPAQRQDSSPSVPSREHPKKSSLRRRKPLTHKRSLSNPLANIILNHSNETRTGDVDEGLAEIPQPIASPNHAHSSAVHSSVLSHHYRSPSPPFRAGSHPAIHTNNVNGSPQPHPRSSSSAYQHPQMKRVAAMTPGFSQSVSSELGSGGGVSGSNPEMSSSVLMRQNTWQSPGTCQSVSSHNDSGLLMNAHEDTLVTPRCNSLIGMSRPRSTTAATGAAHDSLLADLTSSSMVDLPVGSYSASTEHLSQGDEECNLPSSSGKSRSVPRLTLMAVNGEGERGKSYGDDVHRHCNSEG